MHIQRCPLLICGTLLLLPVSAHAQDVTGDGDGVTWNDTANWTGGVIPTVGVNADIGDGSMSPWLPIKRTTKFIGNQSAGTGILTVSAGTTTGCGWIKIGANADHIGTYA